MNETIESALPRAQHTRQDTLASNSGKLQHRSFLSVQTLHLAVVITSSFLIASVEDFRPALTNVHPCLASTYLGPVMHPANLPFACPASKARNSRRCSDLTDVKLDSQAPTLRCSQDQYWLRGVHSGSKLYRAFLETSIFQPRADCTIQVTRGQGRDIHFGFQLICFAFEHVKPVCLGLAPTNVSADLKLTLYRARLGYKRRCHSSQRPN